jgi:hypothetical protein
LRDAAATERTDHPQPCAGPRTISRSRGSTARGWTRSACWRTRWGSIASGSTSSSTSRSPPASARAFASWCDAGRTCACRWPSWSVARSSGRCRWR